MFRFQAEDTPFLNFQTVDTKLWHDRKVNMAYAYFLTSGYSSLLSNEICEVGIKAE